MAMNQAKMTVSERDGVMVVTLADQKILDELSISTIGKELNSLVARATSPKLVLNFRNVTNMSSSALGMLITLHKRVREASGQLRLCHIQPNIAEVFQITRLDEIFTICEDEDAAVAALQG
jgi:anti-sigma B factor antagonist